MEWIAKNWPPVLLLLAGIAASIGAYVASNRDSTQKDQIQNLAEQNVLLSKQIQELNRLNNSIATLNTQIAERVETISRENKQLSIENIDLVKQSKQLISEVQSLSTKSQELISKIDKTTTYNSEENLLSGGLNMKFKFTPLASTINTLELSFGGSLYGTTISQIVNTKEPNGHTVTPTPQIKLSIDDKKSMFFSTKVYDKDGNILVEIEKNYWRINKNFISKYNYDENGFEIIDNKGHVILSIDITDGYKVKLQGIFADIKSQEILIVGESNMFIFNKRTGMGVSKNCFGRNINSPEALEAEINLVQTKRIFEYSGDNWLHKRR